MIWEVPKLWIDETVYIIGGGPSVWYLDLSLIHDKNVIGVNNAYRLGDWVDICWFGDTRWLKWHTTFPEFASGWEAFGGKKATCIASMKNDKRISYVEMSGKQVGIETNPKKVCWNSSSGGSAINLAYHLGAKKIVLLGFDMQLVDLKQNWHDEHISHANKPNPYPKFLKPFVQISEDLNRLGVEVVNACTYSAIPEELIKKRIYTEILNEG